MALFDSSVLIDYLQGQEDVVERVLAYSDSATVTVPLVMFELYQGEVFKASEPDFRGLEDALDWIEVVDETSKMARGAADLQRNLEDSGSPLAARDAYVAGAARAQEETLVASDMDFDVQALRDELDVDIV